MTLVSYFVIEGVLFRAVLGKVKLVMPQVVVWSVKRGDHCSEGDGKFAIVVLGESGETLVLLSIVSPFFFFFLLF